MAGPEFWQTGMGRKFYDHDVPELTKSLNRLAAATEAKAPTLELQRLKSGLCPVCGSGDGDYEVLGREALGGYFGGEEATYRCSECEGEFQVTHEPTVVVVKP